jgi:hypothetical protein
MMVRDPLIPDQIPRIPDPQTTPKQESTQTATNYLLR